MTLDELREALERDGWRVSFNGGPIVWMRCPRAPITVVIAAAAARATISLRTGRGWWEFEGANGSSVYKRATKVAAKLARNHA